MNCNEGVSEIIGAIALIGIIVAVFGIIHQYIYQ
jgi:FlaG/FlaF family flagellin (archaellin)